MIKGKLKYYDPELSIQYINSESKNDAQLIYYPKILNNILR